MPHYIIPILLVTIDVELVKIASWFDFPLFQGTWENLGDEVTGIWINWLFSVSTQTPKYILALSNKISSAEEHSISLSSLRRYVNSWLIIY